MAFTAKDVQRLREMTGVGMMDCKKALTQTDGDFDRAIEILREKGLAAAAKKASRVAADGLVHAFVGEGGAGAILEVNSETDFVAKNPSFQAFVYEVAAAVLKNRPADVDALLAAEANGQTVAAALQEKILTIGENIKIRRFEVIEGGAGVVNEAYVHMGGKIGVLVSLAVDPAIRDSAEVATLARDIALQIAAMNPGYLNRDEVPADVIAKEKEILLAQTIEEGKPEKVAQKIVEGRIGKYYQENCLVDQAFVKENKISVTQHVAEVAKAVGGSIAIAKFVRFEKGEGIAKREDNFAEEIAKLTK